MPPIAGNPIQPVCFGPPHRRLFGIHHAPAAGQPGRPGVVLCNAFGQEAVRAHRLMRVLAERLARQGHPVLRFDPFGTGDSMGDDRDGDLDGWADDLLQADAELRPRCGGTGTVWIAMRLGAAVALRAAQRAPASLMRLVLWDAVLDGPRYLEHLRERHVASLEGAFSLMPRPTPRELACDPANFRSEAIGFELSTALREQIGGLRVSSLGWPDRPTSIVALSDPDDADGRDLAAACLAHPARVQVVPVRHSTDWTTDTADNSALVPTQALLALVQQAGAAA